jgi:flagellar basal body P-ring formation protein FlgA
VDWAAASPPPFTDAALLTGRTLTRAVAPGQALRGSDLLARQWFALGDTVRILAAGAGYAISTEGQALTPGVEGQNARVRTEAGRVLTGRPVGDKRIEVAL